jgi:hypothetical protein
MIEYWAATRSDKNGKFSILAKVFPLQDDWTSTIEIEVDKIFYASGYYKQQNIKSGYSTKVSEHDLADERDSIKFVFEDMV